VYFVGVEQCDVMWSDSTSIVVFRCILLSLFFHFVKLALFLIRSGEGIAPMDFKKAKLMLSGFIETNPRAFKKPSPAIIPTGPTRSVPTAKPLARAKSNTNTSSASASSSALVKPLYEGIGPAAFAACCRAVAPYATRHVRLQCTSTLATVSAYAAMYLGDKCPTKNWNKMDKSM
jgi:hypothetical protein